MRQVASMYNACGSSQWSQQGATLFSNIGQRASNGQRELALFATGTLFATGI